MPKKVIGIYEIDAISTLTAPVAALIKQLQSGQSVAHAIHMPTLVTCDYC